MIGMILQHKLEIFLWEYELGDRSFDSGKTEEAIDHYEKSITIFPKVAGYLALGNAYYAAEEFGLAKSALEDALILVDEHDLEDSQVAKMAQDPLVMVETYLAK